MRLWRRVWISVAFLLCGCGPSKPSDATQFTIDAASSDIAGISLGMTEVEIRQASLKYTMALENQEGDDYKIYNIRIADGVSIKGTLSLENTLARIDVSSPEVRDQFGLGVGSKLSELKRAYPLGKFIAGDEEKLYATFTTGGRLIFRFNPDDLPKSCFDFDVRSGCDVDEAITVKEISIG